MMVGPKQPLDSRYARQVLLPELGAEGQERLAESSVLVIGCGALGAAVSELLVRAGVGRISVADRDIVEIHNLHRQLLFTEADVAACFPKAEAAATALRAINSEVKIEARVIDVAPRNIESLIAGFDLVIDGTDNIETRYLLNDAALETEVRWIYGGAVGTSGMMLNIFPGVGPCLACAFPEPPPPGALPTCDTVGVLNALPIVIAGLQSAEALKILVGSDAVNHNLMVVDLWQNSFQSIEVKRSENCAVCAHGQRHFLHEVDATRTVRLCGRNAVQVEPAQELGTTLVELHEKLSRLGNAELNDYLIRFTIDDLELLIFADGRTIVRGTTDPTVARRCFAKYVGN